MIAAPVVGPRDPGRRPDGMIATMSDAPLNGIVALLDDAPLDDLIGVVEVLAQEGVTDRNTPTLNSHHTATRRMRTSE